MKTLIFADDLLISREDEKKSKGNIILWNLIIFIFLLINRQLSILTAHSEGQYMKKGQSQIQYKHKDSIM
jgi:hypothetical protein